VRVGGREHAKSLDGQEVRQQRDDVGLVLHEQDSRRAHATSLAQRASPRRRFPWMFIGASRRDHRRLMHSTSQPSGDRRGQ
jgi:hypothetical protein